MKNIHRFLNLITAICLVLGMLAVLPAQPAYASTLTVDTLADEQDNSCLDGDCSLRDAVKVAIANDTIDFSVTGTIDLTLGDIAIDKDITIVGPGSSQLTVDAGHLSRHFYISAEKTVGISGLTLTNGRVTQYHGGSIQNSGTLTLDDMVLTHNEVLATKPASYVNGGAIANWGSLSVSNSTISDNSAWYLGGGIYSYFGKTLSLTNVILDGNIATGNPYPGGGGLFIASSNGSPSTATMIGITVTNNTSMYYGGGIYIQEYANVTIQDSVISGNEASGDSGGGLRASAGTALVISNSTIQGNSSLKDGAGIQGNTLASLEITHSNISGNTILDDTYGGGDGAGMFIASDNTVITNSTISNNSGAYLGGGAYFYNGTTSLNNVTIAGNSANYDGGLYVENTLTVKNSILANNVALLNDYEDCAISGGTLVSDGYNLIEVTTGGCAFAATGDITGQDPVLGILANNGGDTQTMALGDGSPALDSGDDSTCEADDQRGTTRPFGSHCDIGAFESTGAFTIESTTFQSVASNDGWILESAEGSNKGGKLNAAATKLSIGDDSANKQYRAILSFDTSGLPDTAIITSVTLKFKHAGKTGTLPFATHGKLLADICLGSYKNNPALELGDFKAKCPLDMYKIKVLSYTNTKIDNWYSQALNPLDHHFVNVMGMTEFRLRFAKDDNNDFGADFLKLFSGDAAEADRPQLVIEYYVP